MYHKNLEVERLQTSSVAHCAFLILLKGLQAMRGSCV